MFQSSLSTCSTLINCRSLKKPPVKVPFFKCGLCDSFIVHSVSCPSVVSGQCPVLQLQCPAILHFHLVRPIELHYSTFLSVFVWRSVSFRARILHSYFLLICVCVGGLWRINVYIIRRAIVVLYKLYTNFSPGEGSGTLSNFIVWWHVTFFFRRNFSYLVTSWSWTVYTCNACCFYDLCTVCFSELQAFCCSINLILIWRPQFHHGNSSSSSSSCWCIHRCTCV